MCFPIVRWLGSQLSFVFGLFDLIINNHHLLSAAAAAPLWTIVYNPFISNIQFLLLKKTL